MILKQKYQSKDIADINLIDTNLLIYNEVERYFDNALNKLNINAELEYGYFEKTIDLTGRITGLRFRKLDDLTFSAIEYEKILVGFDNPISRISQSLEHIYDEMGTILVNVVGTDATFQDIDNLCNYFKLTVSKLNYNIYEFVGDRYAITIKSSPLLKTMTEILIDGVQYYEYRLQIDFQITKNVPLANEQKYYITYDSNLNDNLEIVDEEKVFELALLGGMGDTFQQGSKVVSSLTKETIGNVIDQASSGYALVVYCDMKNDLLKEWVNLRYSRDERVKDSYILVIESPLIEVSYESSPEVVFNRQFESIYIQNINLEHTEGKPLCLGLSYVPKGVL